jgi:hypothetical protein
VKLFPKAFLIIILAVVMLFLLFGYLSSMMGWYGYKKWEHRVASRNIEESKKRGVFISELSYRVDSFPSVINNFKPFIERGFMYGHHSSEHTRPLSNGSRYPYQLTFDYKPNSEITILIRESELKKFDSSNASWGYLSSPKLRDTIVLDIYGEKKQHGTIEVWQ